MAFKEANAIEFFTSTGDKALFILQRQFPDWAERLNPYCNAIDKRAKEKKTSLSSALAELVAEAAQPSVKATLMAAWRHMLKKPKDKPE